MSVDRLVNLLATVALMGLMLTIGVGVTFSQLATITSDWRGILRALVANYLLVPVAAVVLVWLFDPSPLVAAGVMVVAVCPGAPYAPPFTATARGDVLLAVALMVLLTASSAVAAPVLLGILVPMVSGSGASGVDTVAVLKALAIAQFLPLCAGLATASYAPTIAARLKPGLERASLVLNVALIGTILVVQFPMLAEVRFRGYVGMVLLLAVSALAGWMVGGPGGTRRRTFAITTAVRNVGVGLMIATTAFPGTPAVTFTTAYGVVQTVVIGMVVLALRDTKGSPSASRAVV